MADIGSRSSVGHKTGRVLEPSDQLHRGGLVGVPVQGHAERDDPVDLDAAVGLVDPPATPGVFRDSTGRMLSKLRAVSGWLVIIALVIVEAALVSRRRV
jgi:hypothetical protein